MKKSNHRILAVWVILFVFSAVSVSADVFLVDRPVLKNAAELLQKKEYFQSRKDWQKLAKKYPQNALFYYRTGQTYEPSGLKQIALLLYRKALKLSPQNKEFQKTVTRLEKKIEKTEKTLNFFYRLLIKNPNLLNLLKLKESSDTLKDSEQFFLYSELAERFPKNPQIKEWILPFYLKKPFSSQTEDFAKKSFEQNPAITEILFKFAEIRPEQAEQWFLLLKKLPISEEIRKNYERKIFTVRLNQTFRVDSEKFEELLAKIRPKEPQSLGRLDFLFVASENPKFTFPIYDFLSSYFVQHNKFILALLFSENEQRFRQFFLQKLDEENSLSSEMKILQRGFRQKFKSKTQDSFKRYSLLKSLNSYFEDSFQCAKKQNEEDEVLRILRFLCLAKTEKEQEFFDLYLQLDPSQSLRVFFGPVVQFSLENAKYRLAQKILSKTVLSPFVTTETLLLYARTLYEIGNYSESYKFYDKSGAKFFFNQDKYRFADAAFRTDRKEIAEKFFSDIVKKEPYHLYALYSLESLLQKKDPQTAMDLIYRIAFLTGGKWDLEQQIAELIRAGMDPKFFIPYRAYLAHLAGKYKKAENLFQSAENELNENLRYLRYQNLTALEDTKTLNNLLEDQKKSLAAQAFRIKGNLPVENSKLEEFLSEYKNLFRGYFFSAELARQIIRKRSQFSNPETFSLLIQAYYLAETKKVYGLILFLDKSNRIKEALALAEYLKIIFKDNSRIREIHRRLLRKNKRTLLFYE